MFVAQSLNFVADLLRISDKIDKYDESAFGAGNTPPASPATALVPMYAEDFSPRAQTMSQPSGNGGSIGGYGSQTLSGPSSFKCAECGKEYTSMADLTTHATKRGHNGIAATGAGVRCSCLRSC